MEKTQLILAAQTGDGAAIENLLLVCKADARRYAYKHCHASDVDDAIQESLIIISQKIHVLRAVASFSGWLFTVIKRECRKLSRAMFKQDQFEEDMLEQQLAQRTDNALRIDLVSALESLPPHYLAIILLRDFEELTLQEIAQRFGEPVSTVKSRLHKARVLVREYLLT